MVLIETAGQAMNRTATMYERVSHGMENTFSLFSYASLVEQKSVMPTTTTGRETKSPPTDFKDDVNQAEKIPPSSELLKKARWKTGTKPMMVPMRAPSSGALKKSKMKSDHHFMRGDM